MRSISSSRADRNRIGGIRGLADLAADFEAVHFGHADVEHYQLVNAAVEQPQRFLAVLRSGDRHAALFESESDDVADMRIVVDHENGMRHFALAFAVVRAVVQRVQPFERSVSEISL
jgi:hypothetical protein